MTLQLDVRWLLLLPLGFILAFVSWVFWNVSREIWVHRRRWIITHREPASAPYPERDIKARIRARIGNARRRELC